jgi:hypothetical protein
MLGGRDPHIVVKKLWRKIGTVRPDQRVELRMDDKASKHEGIAQGLEYGPSEGRRQIDLPCRAVSKPKPHDVATNVPRLENMVVLHDHSSGAMPQAGEPVAEIPRELPQFRPPRWTSYSPYTAWKGGTPCSLKNMPMTTPRNRQISGMPRGAPSAVVDAVTPCNAQSGDGLLDETTSTADPAPDDLDMLVEEALDRFRHGSSLEKRPPRRVVHGEHIIRRVVVEREPWSERAHQQETSPILGVAHPPCDLANLRTSRRRRIVKLRPSDAIRELRPRSLRPSHR